MKSLFKRAFATATGSVLALSQLAAVATSINVVTAESTLVVDKDFVLNVPIDEADPLKDGQFSDWADQAEAKLISVGNKNVKLGLDKAKDQIIKRLPNNSYISNADAEELAAAIAETAQITSTTLGDFTVTVAVDDCGVTIGRILENFLETSGTDLTYQGEKLDIDWTQYKMSGKVVLTGKTDFANKSVTYSVSVFDENGKEYKGDTGIEAFGREKLSQAAALIDKTGRQAADDAIAENPAGKDKAEEDYTKFKSRLDDIEESLSRKVDYIRTLADAVNAIAVAEQTAIEDAYQAYTDAADSAVRNADVPESFVNRVMNAIEKREPSSVRDALTKERVASGYDRVVESMEARYDIDVTLTLDDVIAILDDSEAFEDEYFAQYGEHITSIKTTDDGVSGSVVLGIYDDQADDLLNAVLATGKTAEEYAGEGYKVVLDQKYGEEVTDFDKQYEIIEIVSHKEITAEADTNYLVEGTLSYDVERVIEEIVVKEVEETTTTTTTETSTTTTESSTTESTTTETSTTESTTTTSGTTDTTDSTSTTTTTLATAVSFDVQFYGSNELIYWSEETDSMIDFSNLKIFAHFIIAGVEEGEPADVTEFFGPAGQTPADLGVELPEGKGYESKICAMILQDAEGLAKVIDDNGYDSAQVMADQGFTDGAAVAEFTITVVLRGDANLDGVVNTFDAQMVMEYNANTPLGRQASYLIEHQVYVMNGDEDQMKLFLYSHYAADVDDSYSKEGRPGLLNTFDAQGILSYFVENEIRADVPWDDKNVLDKHVIPDEELHADPLYYDYDAKADYNQYYGIEG